MAGNAVVPVLSGFPGARVSNLTLDTTRPLLQSFSLNMNDGTLALTFDKAVRASSLQSTGITLQSFSNASAAGAISYRLTGGSSTSPDGVILVLDLTSQDINAIKAVNVAKATSNTYLSMSNQTVTDTAFIPNWVEAIGAGAALGVQQYVADSTKPLLAGFQLVLASPVQLILTFNEPMWLPSFNASGLQLQADQAGSQPLVDLTGGSITPVVAITNGFAVGRNVVTIQLNEADITALETAAGLGKDINNTWLAAQSFTLADMSGNQLVSVPTTQGIQANQISSVETYTALVSASLDLEHATLTLSFSNVIVPSSLKVRSITLQSTRQSVAGQVYSLTNSTTNSTFGYVLVIALSGMDMLGLSQVPPVARSQATTFITLQASALSDILGNDVLAVTDGKAVQIVSYIPRTTPPQLLFFAVNMSQGTLWLQFSDALDPRTVQVQSVVLLSAAMGSNVTLTNGTVWLSADQQSLQITLTSTDLNAIKATDVIAKNLSTTYLAILTHFGNSSFGIPVVSIGSSNPLLAGLFFADVIPPNLVSFSVDLNASGLTLTFDETVRVSTFMSSGVLTIQSSLANPVARLVLSYTYVHIEFGNSPVVHLVVSSADMQNIALTPGLLVNLGSSYVSIAAGAVVDMAGNNCSASTVAAWSYHSDMNSPQLIHFDVDFNKGTLSLLFNKVINASTVIPALFTAQSSANATSTGVSLAGATVLGGNGISVNLSIPIQLLNQLKTDAIMLTNTSSFLCTFSAASVAKDMYGNSLTVVPCSAALPAGTYIPDSTAPLATSFNFSINSSVASLYVAFNEPVVVSSTMLSLLRLSSGNAGNSLVLGGGVIQPPSGVSSVLQILLTLADTDTLKLQSICLASSTCTLSISSGFIQDVSFNNIQNLNITPSAFTADSISPMLVAADLDMNSGYITLIFSEPINATTINTTLVFLQNQP